MCYRAFQKRGYLKKKGTEKDANSIFGETFRSNSNQALARERATFMVCTYYGYGTIIKKYCHASVDTEIQVSSWFLQNEEGHGKVQTRPHDKKATMKRHAKPKGAK
jgi:hypothetical protein